MTSFLEAANDHPGHPLSGKGPVGACHRGGTFEPIGLPAGHLSGLPRDAMETTFNADSRLEWFLESTENPVKFTQRASLPVTRKIRISACRIRTMCEGSLNRPATPLHDAHQGGCFMYAIIRKGGDR